MSAMEKEKLESLLIDYLDGALDAVNCRIVEEELSKNYRAKKILEELKEVMSAINNTKAMQSSSSMQLKFEYSLAAEILLQQKPKQVFMKPRIYRAAAAIGFVFMIFGIGYWVNKNQQQALELANLKNEMEATKKMLMTMLDNRQSASQRVQGATIAYTISKPDNEVVNALAKAMNEDPNTNVRLAALEALTKFYQEEHVRRILIKSLSDQKDEVVQMALIQVLVKMKEKGIIKELEKISRDTQVLKAVKDEAFTGILKLS